MSKYAILIKIENLDFGKINILSLKQKLSQFLIQFVIKFIFAKKKTFFRIKY
jgi:hypothetical protein